MAVMNDQPENRDFKCRPPQIRGIGRFCVRTTTHGACVAALAAFVFIGAARPAAITHEGDVTPSTQPTSRPAAATSPAVPSSVDLRPKLQAFDLPPRAQGARGTCSVFTTCEAIEFAVAVKRGKGSRLSPEYLNWAASQAAGAPSDGAFFHNALAGFEKFGLCTEEAMPYQAKHDPALAPSKAAADEAAKMRQESDGEIVPHWIVPWKPDRFGVDDAQFAEIKRVLASGYPVAAGSGHSRLLVGFRDDAAIPGGGAFITEDSALARFDEVTYEFVRKQVADVFWVEAKSQKK